MKFLRAFAFFVFVLEFFASFASANSTVEATEYTKIYGRVQYAIPKLSGDEIVGGGGSFLLDKKNRLWATAAHVIPETYPSFKDKYVKVNGIRAELVCFSSIADVAIVQTESVPESSMEAVLGIAHPGDAVTAIMSGDGLTSFAETQHETAKYTTLVTTAKQDFYANVVSVFEAGLFTGSATPEPTGMVFISLDKAVRTGFSGGPITNVAGQVVGIVTTINGGVTYVSSASNIQKVLSSETCRKKLT